MAGRGRPKLSIDDLYDKYVAGKEEIIISDCRNGADNPILAKRLGCGKTTLGTLIRYHEGFAKLIREGKEEADLKVESALYKRAIGYDYEETTTEVRVNPDGDGSTTYVKKIKRHVSGDTTAQIFWLKNRKPDNWRDKQDVNLTDNSWVAALKSLNDEHEDKRGGETNDNK